MPKKYLWPAVITSIALGLALMVGLFVLLTGAPSRRAAAPAPVPATSRQAGPPAGLEEFTLAPDEVRQLTPEEARAANADIPNSTLPIKPARPFIVPIADVENYGRALDCMTAAVYYEAGSESPQGQAAVAQVVLNRMRHPAYPKTVCGVVFQGSERVTGCQFTFTCDGSLARTPSPLGWARARAVAGAALNGVVATGVGMSTHYHADFVVPYWAPRLVKIGQIGAHIFYRWPGAWGLPSAFTGRYGLTEPTEAKIAALSSFGPPTTGLEVDGGFVLPELPPLPPPPAPPPPRITPHAGGEPIRIEAGTPTSAAPPPTAAPPRAPQALPDPLAASSPPPGRSRRIPAPQN